jgi:deoxyhypusine synthase
MFSEVYKSFGFQATNVGKSIEIINKMIKWRLSDVEVKETDPEHLKDPEVRKNIRCTIFLGYTSNMASCGMRDIIRYLCEHRMVDAIVTTAGGVEEDFIKCLAPTYMGDFELKGAELREKDINRIGNLLIPNSNYCKFEDWIQPHLDEMLDLQKTKGKVWTPSKVIKFLGQKMDNKESIYYWAAKNKIPVFCPAITDGSLGDMFFFHSYRKPGLVVDILRDVVKINKLAISAKQSGMVILGGGLIKHHICNANMMRNGADYAAFINAAQEFDGSDSGARPDEAISWGKIKTTADYTKVYCDTTLVFPIIVAETFVKHKELSTKLFQVEEIEKKKKEKKEQKQAEEKKESEKEEEKKE